MKDAEKRLVASYRETEHIHHHHLGTERTANFSTFGEILVDMTLLVNLQAKQYPPPAGPKARLVVYIALPVESRAKSYPPRCLRESNNWLSALCPGGGGGGYVPSPYTTTRPSCGQSPTPMPSLGMIFRAESGGDGLVAHDLATTTEIEHRIFECP